MPATYTLGGPASMGLPSTWKPLTSAAQWAQRAQQAQRVRIRQCRKYVAVGAARGGQGPAPRRTRAAVVGGWKEVDHDDRPPAILALHLANGDFGGRRRPAGEAEGGKRNASALSATNGSRAAALRRGCAPGGLYLAGTLKVAAGRATGPHPSSL